MTQLTALHVQQTLRAYATSQEDHHKRIKQVQIFFKTGSGQYGEGDVFIGVSVPKLRKFAAEFKQLALPELQTLLASEIHEERFLALLILVNRYDKASVADKEKIYKFYVKNMKHINNWDLVDTSASYIVGAYLFDKNREVLETWAHSNNLWERRIAIIATHYFIKKNDFEYTLRIAKILLHDKHDLIHKAVGWMLREMGKKELKPLEQFLDASAHIMPRTMLRYAIEKLPEKQRLAYLRQKKI
jgi:3-methyladenine DNA glycosylase AlkD